MQGENKSKESEKYSSADLFGSVCILKYIIHLSSCFYRCIESRILGSMSGNILKTLDDGLTKTWKPSKTLESFFSGGKVLLLNLC